MRSKKQLIIIDALEAAAGSNGYELVDVELAGAGHNTVVRVYLDKPDGLTLDAVAEANTWVSETLDALDPFTGSYTLEVSSPGIDRPLRTLQHFSNATGQTAVIELEPTPEKRRSKYTGTIIGTQETPSCVVIQTDDAEEKLDFLSIKKAHIKGQVSFDNRKDA